MGVFDDNVGRRCVVLDDFLLLSFHLAVLTGVLIVSAEILVRHMYLLQLTGLEASMSARSGGVGYSLSSEFGRPRWNRTTRLALWRRCTAQLAACIGSGGGI